MAYSNGTLYFIANEGNSCFTDLVLWKTDDTPAGTMPVFGAGQSPFTKVQHIVSYQNALYSVATSEATGKEIWETDGTPAGTLLLKGITPGSLSSVGTSGFTIYKDKLYFSADDTVHGRELWATDGTGAGTILVNDIAPSSISRVPQQLAVL